MSKYICLFKLTIKGMKKFSCTLFVLFHAFISPMFMSCSDDTNNYNGGEEKMHFSDVTLTAGSSQNLTIGKELSWKSQNDFIATIVNGEVIAKHVGKTKMICSKGAFLVTVKPKYNYFDEPYINFGSSKDAVKYEVNKNERILVNNDSILMYKGDNMTEYVIYHFTDKMLDASTIATTMINKNKLEDWSLERYMSIATLDNSFSMITMDFKTVINYTTQNIINEDYYIATYKKYK